MATRKRSDPNPESSPDWLDRVRRSLRDHEGRALVAAVSGGSDSVGLLRAADRLAQGLRLRLVVAHLDHGARGESSEADARFVADLAERLQWPSVLGVWKHTRGAHFEADARRARHEWLTEVAQGQEASAVLVGHTRDDQAETILHRIVRGTGLRGLGGMHPSRKLADGIQLVRPLLRVDRSSIREWLTAIGQDWREDATNEDRSRTRARIRHDLIPRLQADYNPRAVLAIARLGELAGRSSLLLRELLRARELGIVRSVQRREIVLGTEPLARLPVSARAELIRMVWEEAGWPESKMGADHWNYLAELAGRPKGRLMVAAGVVAQAGALNFRLIQPSPTPTSTTPGPAELGIPGTITWSGRTVTATEETEPLRKPPEATEFIDRDALDLDPDRPVLTIRAPRPDDRFDPLGMDGKTMALKHFLRARGLRRDERARVALVCDRSGIVWVVGHRIAQRVRRTRRTARTLGLSTVAVDPTGGDS